MTKYDDLTRNLLAAGGAPSSEDGSAMNLVYEEGGDLVLKEMAGNEVKNQSMVASGVKNNTDAPYIQMDDKQLVFCIDEANTLKCFMYNTEIQDWEELDLSEEDIIVHPQSRLTACLGTNEIMAFFQAPTGDLKGIKSEKGSWEIMGDIPAKPAKGTPLSVIVADDEPNLFYLHEDKNAHYVVQDLKSGAWKDHVLEDAKFETPITRFIVSKDPETNSFVAAILAGGVLFVVKDGKKKELGKVVNQKFVPATKAEAIPVGYIPIYGSNRGTRYGRPVYYNNGYWNNFQPRLKYV